eukprot:Awhi_evm1s10275
MNNAIPMQVAYCYLSSSRSITGNVRQSSLIDIPDVLLSKCEVWAGDEWRTFENDIRNFTADGLKELKYKL